MKVIEKKIFTVVFRIFNKKGNYKDINIGEKIQGIKINGDRPEYFKIIKIDKEYTITKQHKDWLFTAFYFCFNKNSDLFKKSTKETETLLLITKNEY